jgi:hypothetical protein
VGVLTFSMLGRSATGGQQRLADSGVKNRLKHARW